MNSTSTLPSYLLRWDHSRGPQTIGEVVQASHRLSETSLFGDSALAALIDRYPRSEIEITTMGGDPSYPSELRRGELGSHCGRNLLSMLARGRLCLTLKNVHSHDRMLRSIIGRLHREWTECLHHSPLDSEAGDLVIESAGTQSYLECDARQHLRWQIRGSRQIHTYPTVPSSASWLVIEGHMVGDADHRANLYFEPAMEDLANVVQIPNESVALVRPLVPHRSIIDESLSVSLITRHFDASCRRAYETLVGNAALRKFVNTRPHLYNDQPLKTTGPISAFSRCIARVFYGNLCRPGDITRGTDCRAASFRLDPDAIDCVAELGAVAESKQTLGKPTSDPVIAPIFTNATYAFPLVASET